MGRFFTFNQISTLGGISLSNEITLYTDPSTGVTREYRQVRRRARQDELVLITGNRMFHGFTVGSIRIANKVDKDDVISDGMYLEETDGSDRDYAVLETTDVIVHDGKRYREVKRKATVDDKVIITKSRDNRWANGEVYTVIVVSEHATYIRHPKGMNSVHGGANLFDSGYAVLEPIATPQQMIVHNGKRYRMVDRIAKVGELIVVTSVVSGRWYAVGEIATVTSVHSKWVFAEFRGGVNNGRCAIGHVASDRNRYNVLEPLDAPQPTTKRHAKPGDRIRIVRVYPTRPDKPIDGIIHGLRTDFNVGDEFTVEAVSTHNNGKVLATRPITMAVIYPQEYIVLDATEPATPGLADTVAHLRTDVDTLTKRVDALDRKTTIRAVAERAAADHAEALGRVIDKPLTGPHPFMACTYTRAQVIEKAKADVESLKQHGCYAVKDPVSWGSWWCNAEFTVNRKNRTVVCTLNGYITGDMRARGTATCAPDDCFNVHIGRAIALRKALGKPVPTYYTHAPKPHAVCVGDTVYSAQSDLRFGVSEKYETRGDRLNIAFVRKEMQRNTNYRIIDDSHDFGGERP